MKKILIHPDARFLETIQLITASLKNMEPHEIHIVNVKAKYGNYQINIGAKHTTESGEKMRPLEINGTIHHLFLTPGRITANPVPRQIQGNMRDTIILRDIMIHLIDQDGHGEALSPAHGCKDAVEIKETINFAGERGQQILHHAMTSGKLCRAVYRLIQKDIISALREHPEESLDEVTSWDEASLSVSG